MLEDVEAFMMFPWGRESFVHTLATLKPVEQLKVPVRPRKKNKKENSVNVFRHQMQQTTIALKGFPLALQLVALCVIPGLLEKLPNASDMKTLRDITYRGPAQQRVISLNNVHKTEADLDLVVSPYIAVGQSGSVILTQWDGESIDKKVAYMEEMIDKKVIFEKSRWPGGDYSGREKEWGRIVTLESRARTRRIQMAAQVRHHRKHVVGRSKVQLAPAEVNEPTSIETQSAGLSTGGEEFGILDSWEDYGNLEGILGELRGSVVEDRTDGMEGIGVLKKDPLKDASVCDQVEMEVGDDLGVVADMSEKQCPEAANGAMEDAEMLEMNCGGGVPEQPSPERECMQETASPAITAAAAEDEDVNEWSPLVLSDSETAEVHSAHIPSLSEHELAARL